MLKSMAGAVSLAVLSVTALGQAGDLPKADEVLDNYIKAMGGREAHDKIRNVAVTGTLEVAGLKGVLKSWQAPPNLTYTEIEIPNMGKVLEGSDGKHAWTLDPATGPRLKEGVEKDAAMRMAMFHGMLHWRKLYKTVETIGVESISGREHYKVKLTPETGEPATAWFDKETGLQTRMAMTLTVKDTQIPVELDFSEYKDVNGLKQPHKVVQKAMGQQQVVTVTQMETNIEMPKDRFEPPAEVKKLIEGGK
jgi:hypothetical protein